MRNLCKPLDRLWSTRKINQNGCVEVANWLSTGGYPKMRAEGKMKKCSHVAWKLHHGEYPKKNLLHKCDNRKCVNVEHLYEGSQKDNMRDAIERNRLRRGEGNARAKLTEEQVVAIRTNIMMSDRQYAAELGVNRKTISKIRQRKAWRHVN